MEKIKSFFALMRIKEWRAFLLMSLFGFLLTFGFSKPISKILIFWLFIFLCLASGFSMNECFDKKEDAFNPTKSNPILKGQLNFKEAFIFSIFLIILALLISSFFGLKFFLFSLLWFFLAIFYSVPPLRFKSKPILDILSHGFFAGAFFFLAPFLAFPTRLNFSYYFLFFSIFYLSIILELRNHIEDYFADKEGGVKNTVLFLGYERSKKFLFFLTILFPLTIFPIFLHSSPSFSLLFLIFTVIFILTFILLKNYRLFDAYSILSYSLIIFNFLT